MQFDAEIMLQNDSLIYCLTDTITGNSFIFSFQCDSVADWSRDESYDNHSVKFTSGSHRYFLIPGTKINYNEPAYNLFPMMICTGDAAVGRVGDAEIFVNMSHDEDMQIFIKEGGRLHRDALRDGMNYKRSYAPNDTIPINDRPYMVAKLTQSSLTLKPVRIADSKILDRSAMAVFENYFDGREYLFVDFWGTWCRPCVESMPQIKALHEQYGDRITFLSVCYDDERNCDLAKQILRRNGIEWAEMFVSENDHHSIVRQLNVTNFPSYLIIDRQGSVLLFVSGTYNIPKVRAVFDAIQ